MSVVPTAAAAAPANEPARTFFRWPFTAPLNLAAALNPINSSIIATGLVPIAHALRVPVGSTAVLVSALYLASAVAQPTAGKLAEVFGPRRVLLCGILIVLAGGLLGGLGQNLAMLTVARVLIGIGTSAGFPCAMVLIKRRADAAGLEAPPGAVLGGLAIAGMATAAIGPPIGGALVGAAGWRMAFLINLPVTVIALTLALRGLPADTGLDRAEHSFRRVAARIDLAGIAGFAVSLTALVVFLMGLPSPRWVALGICVAACVPFVWWELRAEAPFFDLPGLAANGALARTYLRQLLTLLGVYTVMYGMTQWMQAAYGMSAITAGLVLLPMGAVSALLSRPLARRNLVRGPLILAGVTMVAGSGGIMLLGSTSPILAIVAVSTIFGVTSAATTVGNQTALYVAAPAGQIGTASGLFRTFGYLGTITSSVIGGIVFRHQVTDGGLHILGLVLVAAGAAVLLLTVLDRPLMCLDTTRQGETRMTTTLPALDPKRTALLAMDFQNGILPHAPEPDALVERVKGAIADVRAAGGTIGYVRVAFTEDDWAAVPETNKAFSAASAAKMLHHEHESTQIDHRITPEGGDIVVRKVRFGGASTTDLFEQLTARDIDTLVLSGISTGGVVLSTLMDAADRDFRVYVLTDGVADPDPEVDRVLVQKVFPSRAHLIDTAELRGLLQAA